MEKSKVKDFPDLMKIGSGVINTNDTQFKAAKARALMGSRIKSLEAKVDGMQNNINQILEILKNRG